MTNQVQPKSLNCYLVAEIFSLADQHVWSGIISWWNISCSRSHFYFKAAKFCKAS